MDVVIVKWADAHCGPSGWQELDDYDDHDEEIVTTVGFHTPQGCPGYKTGHMTIWQTIAGREGIHPFHIPAEMVRNVTILCSLETQLDFDTLTKG